jgi:uncharacterized protein YjiS (DUF1127 family)
MSTAPIAIRSASIAAFRRQTLDALLLAIGAFIARRRRARLAGEALWRMSDRQLREIGMQRSDALRLALLGR